jgi:oxygen-independent coproporphyrinogen-3 oxidase
LQLRKSEFDDQTLKTIYFGGGTPSLLTMDELQLLIDCIYNNYKVVEAPEITLEANPDDLNKDIISQLSKSPINRLSIGIQSFFNDDLKGMNRAHNAREAQLCLEESSKYFDNISIDLIYGIPNMDLDKWDENLQIAFNSGINHISSYALTVEPKTALDYFIKKGDYPPIDEALALSHFDHLMKKSAKEGFVQYEISNFGRPNYFSKHNMSYWKGKPYLGIGPSAHSFDGKTRRWNISNNSRYIQAIEKNILPVTVEKLSNQDRYNEYIMTGLRTLWGVSIEKVESDFGMDYKDHMTAEAQSHIDKGLISHREGVLYITKTGKFLADGIASDLFMI